MKQPKVSIVIITYNEEKNIGDCLSSLERLNYPKNNYEIIVIDSSEDNTAEIARKYSKVKVYQVNEKGFAVQRNIGINKAKYELIAFTDADCIAPQNWLQNITQKVSDRVVGVGGNAYPPEDSPYIGKCIACLGTPAGGALGFDAVLKREKEGISTIITCNAIYKKEVLKKVGMFDTKLKYGGEDSNICKRIRDQGYVIEYEPNSFVYHKTRNSLSDFLKWSVRRGKANYFVEPSSRFQLLFFLPLWSIFLLIAMVTLIIFKQYFYALFIPFIIWGLSLGIFFLGARKKAKMLLKRRRKIKIDLISIFIIIPLLFYLRNIARNFGEVIQRNWMKQ